MQWKSLTISSPIHMNDWFVMWHVQMFLCSRYLIHSRNFCPVAPERIWKWGHRSEAKVGSPIRKIFFRLCPYTFWWALSWWSVQFGQFLVCCSSTHGAPRAQPFVKVGARPPRAPWSRCHCFLWCEFFLFVTLGLAYFMFCVFIGT